MWDEETRKAFAEQVVLWNYRYSDDLVNISSHDLLVLQNSRTKVIKKLIVLFSFHKCLWRLRSIYFVAGIDDAGMCGVVLIID